MTQLFSGRKYKKSLQNLILQLPNLTENHPILIATFNNPTYLKMMVDQIRAKDLGPIIILDSHSTNPEMLSVLKDYESQGIGVLRFTENVGPRFLLKSSLIKVMPNNFILTDPDLKLSTDFSKEHLNYFVQLSEMQRIGKVGCTLSIKDSQLFRPDIFFRGMSIYDWENQFWQNQLECNDDVIAYTAIIDTTFAMYNKKYFKKRFLYSAIRVDKIRGKDVSARHLPWYIKTDVPADEIKNYTLLSQPDGIPTWGIG